MIEPTSVNMGVGLVQVCRYHGLRLSVVVDAVGSALFGGVSGRGCCRGSAPASRPSFRSAATSAASSLIFPDGGAGYLESVYDDEWVRRELGCEAATLADSGSTPTAAAA